MKDLQTLFARPLVLFLALSSFLSYSYLPLSFVPTALSISMASHFSRDSLVVDDREYLSGRQRPRSEAGYYDRREDRRDDFRSSSRDGRVRETSQIDVRVRERSRERERDPLARYFREDRRAENGAMVVRQREVETVERPRARARSPTPVRVREVIRQRSLSRSPSPPDRAMSRVEIRDRVVERDRDRYRAPEDERVVTRIVQRERERTPSSSPERRDRIRITQSRAPSPSPSPPPPEPRPVIRGPVVEREVITHYTDVDHGKMRGSPPLAVAE